MFKDFTEMPVWQKAMEIAVECFFLSERLPRKEDYGLTSQLRRSAESISANIAETFGRRSNKDKSRVYDISRSEAFETKNHLIYGNKVQYLQTKNAKNLLKN
jgi:four helix bundle protein